VNGAFVTEEDQEGLSALEWQSPIRQMSHLRTRASAKCGQWPHAEAWSERMTPELAFGVDADWKPSVQELAHRQSPRRFLGPFHALPRFRALLWRASW